MNEGYAPARGVLLHEADEYSGVELTRVPAASLTRRSLSPLVFVYTAGLDLERTYAVTIASSAAAVKRTRSGSFHRSRSTERQSA